MDTNKLPTAREFLKQELPHRFITILVKEEIYQAIIEFAKLHVQEALTQASENVIIKHIGHCRFIEKESILTAYNLDEIK